MSKDVRPDNLLSAVHVGALTKQEAQEILALRDTPVWGILKKLMVAMRKQSDISLRNPSTSLREMRIHQGRIGQINELVNFVEDDLPEWYKKFAP